MIPALNLTASTIISRHPDQVSAEIAGEVVVMAITQGKYVGFDDITSVVWRYMEQPRSLSGLCELLAQDFEGDPAAIQADVMELLRELHELGLVVIETGTPGIQHCTAAV